MIAKAVPRQVRIVSLLIWMLSRKCDLGLAYILSRGQYYDLEGVDVMSTNSVALFLVQWLADVAVRDGVHAGLSSLENQHRILADQFLVHSLLMEFIIAQNKKGVALDLTSLIAKYPTLDSSAYDGCRQKPLGEAGVAPRNASALGGQSAPGMGPLFQQIRRFPSSHRGPDRSEGQVLCIHGKKKFSP